MQAQRGGYYRLPPLPPTPPGLKVLRECEAAVGLIESLQTAGLEAGWLQAWMAGLRGWLARMLTVIVAELWALLRRSILLA